MSCFLYENHWGSPTLILLNVLGVLNVLYVLNVLHVLHVLHGRIVGLLGLVLLFHWSFYTDVRLGASCMYCAVSVWTVQELP